MIITLENLQRGLECRQQIWPNDVDVRNSLYKSIYDVREGVTNDWWEATVERLSKWKAIRGCTKDEIRNRGLEQLEQIRQQYERLKGLNSAGEPCITDLEWADIDQLFGVAAMIKPSRSPMFASKMCHFLFPKLFIIIDGEATGLGHYELYWRGLKDAWTRFEHKTEARNILFAAINNGQNKRHEHYPEETTIMEICVIGYNNPR